MELHHLKLLQFSASLSGRESELENELPGKHSLRNLTNLGDRCLPDGKISLSVPERDHDGKPILSYPLSVII